jgi:hypothetical protein
LKNLGTDGFLHMQLETLWEKKKKKVGLETGIRIGAAEFYFDGVLIKQTIEVPGAYRQSMHLYDSFQLVHLLQNTLEVSSWNLCQSFDNLLGS